MSIVTHIGDHEKLGTSILPTTYMQRLLSSPADTRKLKKWFDGSIAGKKICFAGDSTTQAFTGLGPPNINFDGSVGRAQFWYPGLRDCTVYARAQVGAQIESFITGVSMDSGKSLADVIALACDVYVIRYGINDCKTTDPATGYTAAQLQTALTTCVTTIKAALPNAVIILHMPNAHRTGSSYITGAATAQNCMTRYQAAYRAMTNYHADVLVLDTMSGLYPNVAWASGTTNPLLDADGLHPSNAGYDLMLHSVLRLFIPQVNARDTDNRIEKSLACPLSYDSTNSKAVWNQSVDPLILEGDDWYKVYRIQLSAESQDGYHYFGVQDYTRTNSNTIGVNAVGPVAPGLVPGDIVSYNNGQSASKTFVVNRAPSDNSGGVVRWYDSQKHPSDISTPNIGEGNPYGYVYRHKYAFCDEMRKLQSLFADNLRYDTTAATANPYAVARRFYIYSAANGSIIIQTIGSETGGDLSIRTFLTTDMLCIPGVTGGSGAGLAAFGLLLTGATFAYDTTNKRVTITKSGVDFRNAVIPQGYVLSAA